MLGEIQSSLFETDLFNNSKAVAEAKLRKFGRNLAVAFGVTKTGLFKGSYGALENVFIGKRNLKIQPKMLVRQNPAEILATFFSTGHLKRRNLHYDLNIPHDPLELMIFLDNYSYKNGFACLAHNFRKFFDTKQRIRLGFLNQSGEGGDEFVKSFLADYKPPYNPNCDGRSKGIYVDIIHRELKLLSDKANSLFSLSSNNS